MKSLAFTVWLFINLLCFGMCSYLYLIWSKYWIQLETQKYISQKPPRNKEYPKSPDIVYYGLNLTNMKFKNNKKITNIVNDISNNYVKSKPNIINKNDFNNNYKEKTETNQVNDYYKNYYRKETEKYMFPNVKQSVIKSVVTRESGNVKTQFLENKNVAQPRFNLETPFIEFDTTKYMCHKNYPSDSCTIKTDKYKNLLFQEFDRRMRNDEKQARLNNRYNVTYNFQPVPKGEGFGKFNSKDRDSVLCELRNVNIRTIKSTDDPFASFANRIPRIPLLKFKHFNTCAIVTSAGALYDSDLGSFIDNHDLVMRFNHAPTEGYEKDVGSKTTIRIVNSKVMTDKIYHFQTAEIFRNVSLLAWDPSEYSGNLQNWYKKPDFDLFSQYKRFMRRNPHADFHLLHPKTLWNLWDFLQNNTPFRILRNPPSSGFLGFAILLQYCSSISVLEYLPSARVSKKCHYYGPEMDTACTFGAWHPLAAEKLSVWKMSESHDYDTFQRGIIVVKSKAVCPSSREL